MVIFYVFAGIAFLGLIGYALQIWAVRSTLKKEDNKIRGSEDENASTSQLLNCSSSQFQFPPVSILKPLKGLDDNLFDNLESFCIQDYPKYKVIFSLQDHSDPAYKVAKKVKDKYPEKDISIIVKRCDDGLNPKVNNLIPAYKASAYDLILISDSNVMVDKDYLMSVVKPMQNPNVGLVSNLINGTGGRTYGSIFENLHLNTFIVGGICFLDKFLKIPCVVGKSMLMRRADFEAIGGFKAVKDVLAEDYIIGRTMHKMGKKVVLSSYIINNVNEYWGFSKFINRHIRWGKLRWKIGGVKYITELISNPIFISILPMLLWTTSKITITFALFVSFAKIIGDFYLGRLIMRQGSTFSPVYYLLSPVKDFIVGILWFVPILSNTVIWRGNRYVIGKDSRLSPCAETGIWSWKYKIIDKIKAKLVL